MTYNFHAHTHRCHHATGTEEEFVLRAIEGGIRVMGFSEHFPFRYPDGHESSYRLSVSEVAEYYKEVMRLKEKYKDKIELHVGFEMEYYPDHFDAMVKCAKEYGAEYLIFGPHFLSPTHEYPFLLSTYTRPSEDVSELHTYASMLIEGMHTGVFTYIAHPDIVWYTGNMDVYREEMGRVCEEAKKCNIPLELNFLGIREGRLYPRDDFWKIAGDVGCPMTFGFDAHSVQSACDLTSLKTAEEMVKKFGLNYIGMPLLKRI